MSTSPSLRYFVQGSTTPHNGQLVTEGSNLQTLVLAGVLTNLVTILIVAVMYFNVVLFGPYASEMIYAVLLSEALFTVRMSMLNSLKTYTSFKWSPRAAILNALNSVRGVFLMFGLIAIVVQATESPEETALGFLSILLFFLLLDDKALFIFRLHHVLISDEALVSLVLVFVLVACLGVFIGSFLVLALRDAAAAVDASAMYLNEHTLKDPLIRAKFNEALTSGKGHIDSISKSLQEQYQGTPYGPAVSLTTNLLSNFTGRFDASEGSATLSFSDWEPLRDEVLSLGFTALYNGTLSVKDAFKNAADGIYVSFAIVTSVLFACFDFGFRATFFTGVLFFLVSSPKSVLQTVLESVLGVFSKAKRSNSVSSLNSDVPPTETETILDVEDRERAQAFRRFEDELRNTFKAVFAVPVSLAGANAFATLVIFSVLNVFGANVNASYFAALIVLIFTLIPIVSPFLSCLPWCVVSSVVHGKHWASISLLASHYFVFNMIDGFLLSSFHNDAASRNQRSFRSYLTGLSFFFGISSMGLHGVVLGPLFVSFFYTTCATILGQYREVFSQSANHKRSRSKEFRVD